MTIGERIRQARTDACLTQVQLAERAGIDRTTISDQERNVTGGSIATVVAIADALNCSIDDLLGRAISFNTDENRMKRQGLALMEQAQEIRGLRESVAHQAMRITQLEGRLMTFCRAFEEEAEQLNCCVSDFKNWCGQARGGVIDNDRPLKRASASDISPVCVHRTGR